MDQHRAEFQAILKAFCNNVYFKPPTSEKILYPCIIYKRDDVATKYANDLPYNHKVRYMVTIIDEDPDSEIPMKVASLPLSRFSRAFTTENLYHDVYSVYF